MQKDAALFIVKKLKEQGYKALFAGGCVRDYIMGITPKDIDIATSAHPETVLKLFPKTFERGKAFGVTAVIMDNHEFEVATFRKEGKYSDGRHPDYVEWTDEKEDALRRDFTINGMFFDPIENKVIDYVGGQADIQNKIIRTIGNPHERFEEDKLRLIRAARFCARLQYKIEPQTQYAIVEMAPLITQVSSERIRDELIKILTQKHADLGIDLLSQLGLLKIILPEVEAMKGVEQPPQFHPEGDVYIHTLLLLKNFKPDISPALAVGALLHDVGKPPTFSIRERIRFDGHTDLGADMAYKILRRLRFPNSDITHISSMIRQHLQFMNVKKMRKSTLKRFIGQAGFEDHLELHRLDCLACHGILENYDFCKEKLEEIKKESPRKKPLITGKDLIKLGFSPGPLFKQILTDVETQFLEGDIKTKLQALKWVKKHFSSQLYSARLKSIAK